MLFFSLPFAGVGLVFFVLILSTLSEWRASQSWQQVQARILNVELKTYSSSDSGDTYEVVVQYSYDFGGRNYEGSRAGLNSGADNIGSYHQDRFETWHEAKVRGEHVPCYVDPKDPTNALLDRELRSGMLLFFAVFLFAFGGVGFGLFIYSLLAILRNRKGTRLLAAAGMVGTLLKTVGEQVAQARTAARRPTLDQIPSETGPAESVAEVQPDSAMEQAAFLQAAPAQEEGTAPAALLWETASSRKVMRRVVLAGIWNFFSLPLLFMIWPQIEEGQFFSTALIVFPVIGLLLFLAMIYDLLHLHKFGVTTLVATAPPSPGSTFEAVLSNRTLQRFDEGFQVQLVARSSSRELFSEESRLAPQHLGRSGLHLPIRLPVRAGELPADLRWELIVSASIPGLDFRARFDLRRDLRKGQE
jgi:hypothetical protein